MSDSDMAYVGVQPCGCVTFVAVDKPEYAADNAREIARLIRSGMSVERTTVADARDRWVVEWPCAHVKNEHDGVSEDQLTLAGAPQGDSPRSATK